MSTFTPRRILITGASAGIGAALARHYAAPGTTLGLVARRAERLAGLADTLRAAGAEARTYTADVRDAATMRAVADDFGAGGVELAIANAGISRGDRLAAGDPAPAADVFAINVTGVLNTLVPLVPGMQRRGRGHLVTVSSVAGFRGIPGKGAYCASKGAERMLMDAWRAELRPHGVRVTTICPGWIETELTAENPYPMPFMMSADKAARLIARAIARGRRTYVFPWQMRLAVPMLRLLPERLLPTYGTRA